MKVEIDEAVNGIPEDVYAVGNVFVADDKNLYLVAKTETVGYCLVNLTLNQVAVTAWTLSDLIKKEYQSTDKLVDVKIVRA